MSKLVAVVGESGTGKSTSLENLDPQSTYIINVVGKDLPFKGSRKKFHKQGGKDGAPNYLETDNSATIIKAIKGIALKRPEIKCIVIDDFQYVMAMEFIDRATEKGYDKWSEMAQNTVNIVSSRLHNNLRDDLTVIVMSHLEEVQQDYKNKKKIKTSGKLIDQHITMEGFFTIVLFTHLRETDEGDIEYLFMTNSDGSNTAKSPKGMLDTFVPNDLAFVLQKMDEYYNS